MPDLERIAVPEQRLEWSRELPADSRAVALARRELRALFARWNPRCLVDDAELVTSELVTNMVRHGVSPAELRVQWEESFVRIAVEDSDPGVPVPRQAPNEAVDGRGLHIIDALARNWGLDRRFDRKVVWADLLLR